MPCALVEIRLPSLPLGSSADGGAWVRFPKQSAAPQSDDWQEISLRSDQALRLGPGGEPPEALPIPKLVRVIDAHGAVVGLLPGADADLLVRTRLADGSETFDLRGAHAARPLAALRALVDGRYAVVDAADPAQPCPIWDLGAATQLGAWSARKSEQLFWALDGERVYASSAKTSAWSRSGAALWSVPLRSRPSAGIAAFAGDVWLVVPTDKGQELVCLDGESGEVTRRARVPAEFFFRDGQVLIRKHCSEHGQSESLVSSDSEAWQAKRNLWQYVPSDPVACTLKCDRCRVDHNPNIVFLDVTNHCNMNCPICIASVPKMGFDYNPPIEYFEKVFAHISQWNPKPRVQLFGGEPTVRNDLLDIIMLARKHGLRANVTTNGIRLADEDYCRKLCEARVQMRFAFEGFSPDIYERLRNNRGAYEKKVKGLDNLKKYTRVKQTIISCFAWGINDQHLAGLIEYVHANRDWVNELAIIPLAETWDPKEFDAAPACTLEDVEKMVRQAVPGNEVEFIPAGLSYSLVLPRRFLRRNPRSDILLLAGVHPNCESVTVLISDGKRYRGVNHYLKVPFGQAAAEFAALCRKIEPRLSRLDPGKWFQRLQGQVLCLRVFVPFALRNVRLRRAIGNPFAMLARSIFKRHARHKDDAPVRRRRRMLRVAMLPFEEQHSVDAGRLENCKSVFTYEDTDTGRMQSIPACMWVPYRNGVLKKIAEKYGVVDGAGRLRTPGTATAADPTALEPCAVK